MVEETVAAKTANLSQSSLVPQSTNSSAQACRSRAVVLFLGRSVQPHRSNSVARCQNKAAGPCPERFPVNNAPTSQDSSAVQCQNRAAGQCRNRAVDRCRSSNAKMFLDSSADRFQRRNALWFLDSNAEVSQVKSVPQCLVNRVAASLARVAGMFQSKNVATSQGSSVGRCQKKSCRSVPKQSCRSVPKQ